MGLHFACISIQTSAAFPPTCGAKSCGDCGSMPVPYQLEQGCMLIPGASTGREPWSCSGVLPDCSCASYATSMDSSASSCDQLSAPRCGRGRLRVGLGLALEGLGGQWLWLLLSNCSAQALSHCSRAVFPRAAADTEEDCCCQCSGAAGGGGPSPAAAGSGVFCFSRRCDCCTASASRHAPRQCSTLAYAKGTQVHFQRRRCKEQRGCIMLVQ